MDQHRFVSARLRLPFPPKMRSGSIGRTLATATLASMLLMGLPTFPGIGNGPGDAALAQGKGPGEGKGGGGSRNDGAGRSESRGRGDDRGGERGGPGETDSSGRSSDSRGGGNDSPGSDRSGDRGGPSGRGGNRSDDNANGNRGADVSGRGSAREGPRDGNGGGRGTGSAREERHGTGGNGMEFGAPGPGFRGNGFGPGRVERDFPGTAGIRDDAAPPGPTANDMPAPRADGERTGRHTGPNRYNDLINSRRAMERPSLAESDGRRGAERREERPAFSRRLGEVAAELDDSATEALLSSGWNAPVPNESSFSNHAERVSTLVGIARELGVDPQVGVMQANFGTPQENGLIDPLKELEALEASSRGDTDEAAALRQTIERQAAAVNPNDGTALQGWEIVDLDVDGNGVVDAQDLERARASEN